MRASKAEILLFSLLMWWPARADTPFPLRGFPGTGNFELAGMFVPGIPLASQRASALESDHPPGAPLVSHSAAGEAAFESGRYAEAEREIRLALEQSASTGNRAEEVKATVKLAAALQTQTRLDQAEPLFVAALALAESLPESQSLLAPLLDKYAQLDEGRLHYAAAEQKFLRAATIAQRDAPDLVCGILDNYARLLIRTGRLAEAEGIEKRAIQTGRTRLGGASPKLAAPLLNLGEALRLQGRLAEAETSIREVLKLAENEPRPQPWMATALNNLAQLRVAQRRWKEAGRLYGQALAEWELSVGRDHPSYAKGLTNLGTLEYHKGKFKRAEALYREALAIDSTRYGEAHPNVALHLNNLGALLYITRRYGEAEIVLRRAAEIYQGQGLLADRAYLCAVSNLARLYHSQKRLAEAELQYQRVEELARKASPAEEPAVARTLDAYSKLLRQRSQPADAERVALEAMRFRVRTALREDARK